MSRINLLTIVSILTLHFMVLSAHADITMPKIFSDHMVLQRDSNVKVWGTAEPNQELVVKFDDQEVKVKAGSTGKWSATIQTPATPGGPFELEVGATDVELKVVFSDVMVGEVWICAGGTNMEWDVSKVLNSENEVELSKNFQNLRLFSVEPTIAAKRLDDFMKVQPWSVCAPETVKGFSGTAYFFGRELGKNLPDYPIGLIELSSPGAACESWCSNETLKQVVGLEPLLEQWKENDDPTSISRPANVFNSMIAPISGFPVRGVIWHQGESNNGRGDQYAPLLPSLIEDWRKEFNNPELRFYIVQLHPFRYESLSSDSLPELWDAQLRTAKKVEGCELAVTVDIGDAKDIHPKNKQEVGRRLSLLALADVYNDLLDKEKREIVRSGPIFDSISINDKRIRVIFNNVGQGLKLAEGDEKRLLGFSICGEDKKFVPAEAVIVGEAVEVSSPDVQNPVAVRLGWEDTAQPNLTNSEGLPASPFRTDNFDLQSAGRHF